MKYIFVSIVVKIILRNFEVAVVKEVKLASVVNESNIVDVSEPKHLTINDVMTNEHIEFKNPVIPFCVSEAVGSHTCVSKELNSPVFDGVNIVSGQAKVEAEACVLSPQVCFVEEPNSLTTDED